MTLDYFLYKLVKAGEKMRDLQKEYVGIKDFSEMRETFIAAKNAEKEFDEILESVKEFLKDKLKQDA